MPIPLIWGTTVAFGFPAWGVFAAQYIWPAISKRERTEALRPILVLHGFSYIGLAVLIPGVVSQQLPATAFARELAYGDLATRDLGPHRARRCRDQFRPTSGLDLQHFWDCRPAECVLPG
jgi:hypothetical protein